jgi:hypothetical protein
MLGDVVVETLLTDCIQTGQELGIFQRLSANFALNDLRLDDFGKCLIHGCSGFSSSGMINNRFMLEFHID